MSYIKFLDSTSKIQDAIIMPLSEHIIEVKFSILNTSGLGLYLDNDMLIGDYNDYTTVYKIIDDNSTQYSNDGSIYIEPIIIELTEEEIAEIEQNNKIVDLQNKISNLKHQLESDDYIIIKLYELSLVGETSTEYDVDKIHIERDNLRNQINVLEEELLNEKL